MTKKILTSANSSTVEFLLPSRAQHTIELIGVDTGETHEMGRLVYCGVTLTAEKLAEKASKAGINVDLDLFEQYLALMPDFRLGRLVQNVSTGEALILSPMDQSC